MGKLANLVRPVLTLGFALTVIWLTIIGQIDPEFLKGMAASTTLFWFGERASRLKPSQEALPGAPAQGGAHAPQDPV